ncbi:hypothetical protein ONZ45_g2612 [Pleurotus djamor]|nr:hypothetical protein ONZ45_g2612 [Pleurotus djamor]
MRLHRKAKAIDSFLDDRSPNSPISPHPNSVYHDQITTARSAWAEARDSLEREAQTRSAFLNTLSVDCLNPLTALRESQERTRKRIKEDLKDSATKYQEFADNVLPKLKGRYSRRFGEVEELRGGPEMRRNVAMPPPSGPSQHNQYANLGVTPPVSAPAHNGGPRNRSPSASTPFADLAQQGKKQFGHFITFLDREKTKGKPAEDANFREQFKDTLKEGLTAVRSMNVSSEAQALKMVKAKRELDEADKEYRKAVHWLETLRLRKTKIIEAGFISLIMFVEEEAQVMKNVLGRYSDNVIATTMTQTQLYTHFRHVVDKISPETDGKRLSARIPPLDTIVPEPVLYEHGHVGECKDLLFGLSLSDYAVAKGLRDGEIPKIVKMCIEEVDQRGLEMEGIYRVSGRLAVVKHLQQEIERDEAAFDFVNRNPRDDVYAVASLLKLYLRELPEPLFKFPLQDRIQHTEALATHKSNNFPLLRSKFRRLPPIHQATLKALIEHLARVAAREEKNKMGKKNLAIVFGTVVFGEDENMAGDNKDGDGPSAPMDDTLLRRTFVKDTLMEDMIAHAHILFSDDQAPPKVDAAAIPTIPDEKTPPPQPGTAPDLPNPHPQIVTSSLPPSIDQTSPSSPPLPPTPAGDPAPIAYGSKTTRVLTQMPNPVATPRHRKTASTSSVQAEDPSTPRRINPSTSATEDFTPKFSSKPAGSIHPSARNNRNEGNNGNEEPPPPPLPLRPPQLQAYANQSQTDPTQIQTGAAPSFVHPPPPPPLPSPVASTITSTASTSSTISANSVTFPPSNGSGRSSPTPPLPPRPSIRRSHDGPIRKQLHPPPPPSEAQPADSNTKHVPLPLTPKSDAPLDLPPDRSPSADSEASWTSAMDTVDDDIYVDAPPSKA